MYDGKVKFVLEQAGWHEGRKINISKQLTILEKCGFEVFDIAKKFIQEYDQLKLRHTEPFYAKFDNIEPGYDNFDIIQTVSWLLDVPSEYRQIRKERAFWVRRTNEKTIPIGGLSDWEQTLFITETGKIITDIIIIGNDIEEGIQNIIKNDSCTFLDESMKKLYEKQV